MGKKIDALLGRTFKTSKFKALVNVAVSRLAVLKNQRQARCSLARADIVQLLNLGHHDRALLRVEQVVKEQNMLDVFVMIEGYCHLVAERTNLLEQERVCPEELKEAVSSLLYASTRCGEFPELIEIRTVFTARFGKEFAARAIELRNNCGVNPKIIQKLSTRQPSLENRLKVLKEIASENNIVLQFQDMTTEGTLETEQNQHQPKAEISTVSDGSKAGDNLHSLPQEADNLEGLSDTMNGRRKYKDVADAAEAAFKSAAYAAAAARAAVELSRSESHDPDDHNNPGPGERNVTDEHAAIKSELQKAENNWTRDKDDNIGVRPEKVHPIQIDYSESEDEVIHVEERAEESEQSKILMYGLNPDSDDILKRNEMPLDDKGETRAPEKGINFDESEDETTDEQGREVLSGNRNMGLDMRHSIFANEGSSSTKSNTITDEDRSERVDVKLHRSQMKFPLRPQTGIEPVSGFGNHKALSTEESRMQNAQSLNVEKRPISVRTRRVRWS